ncbi:metal ABC transporter solute-binding protein, Zn/Mn family [uncultured Bifidobacterium sp.]|uniref:metal ABC transporter solute-binding protein, Zn/Mn family n=1 Tax=uncultured Bifidobacterium sp. TaxID=165187 RepID=UPI0028DB7420|nr:zinc ABC transporter substrate-binding protein [uncultured Bifidobacterium sp.]
MCADGDRTLRAALVRRIRRGILAASAALSLLVLPACGSAASTDAAASDGLAVVASINQWGSMARDLGGSLVSVTSIMTNTNVEAHDYEPTTQDVARFSSAKVVVVNGADYDSWASKAASSTSADLVDAATAGGKSSGDNPHVWFSSTVRSRTADAITTAYRKADPDHASRYSSLNAAWHKREDALDKLIASTRSTTKGKEYAATESVAWYLADDLGMTDATPSGYAQAVANEGEPSASDITSFQKELAKGAIRMLIVNTQEADSVTDTITTSARTNDVPIVNLTEQMPSRYDDLIDWMTALVRQFAKA